MQLNWLACCTSSTRQKLTESTALPGKKIAMPQQQLNLCMLVPIGELTAFMAGEAAASDGPGGAAAAGALAGAEGRATAAG